MTQIVSARNFRQKTSEMINLATYAGNDIIITRFDKPQATLINYQKYQALVQKIKAKPKNSSKNFLLGLAKLNIKGGPHDLSQNMDKYLYD